MAGNAAVGENEQVGEAEAQVPPEVLDKAKVSKEVRQLLGDNSTFQLLGSGGPRSSSGRKRSRPDYYKGELCSAGPSFQAQGCTWPWQCLPAPHVLAI